MTITPTTTVYRVRSDEGLEFWTILPPIKAWGETRLRKLSFEKFLTLRKSKKDKDLVSYEDLWELLHEITNS